MTVVNFPPPRGVPGGPVLPHPGPTLRAGGPVLPGRLHDPVCLRHGQPRPLCRHLPVGGALHLPPSTTVLHAHTHSQALGRRFHNHGNKQH